MGCAESNLGDLSPNCSSNFTIRSQYRMQKAISNENLEDIHLMINQGFNLRIRMRNLNQNYPLHIAAEKGSLEITSYFLKKGADPNSEDSSGLTPIVLAALNHHEKCVILLENAGAKFDVDSITEAQIRKYMKRNK